MSGFAIYPFDFGFLEIEYNDNFEVTKLKRLTKANNYGNKTSFTENVFLQISEYLQGKRKSFDIPIKLYGTEFQLKVWNELCKIPYGETRIYKQIACAIGNPKDCRAVGRANNKNPIIVVVPCHRVIGSNNSLVGYAEGLDMKEALLTLENITYRK